jgi:outer membrane protein OmpA-like peptidoglycan-associated protein
MGGRALSATRERIDTAPIGIEHGSDNPGLRLLDALGAGDVDLALELCGPATTVSAENMAWSCQGHEQIRVMLGEARDRFPGLTFEPRSRDVGFGLVVAEARVTDVEPEVAPDGDPDGDPDDTVALDPPSDHPMYDDPMFDRGPTSSALVLWRDLGGDDQPPAPLNMPVRVTVRHDDLQVHEIALSFPAALLKRALGERVDPFELALSEVQSAFVAPALSTTRATPAHDPDPAPLPDDTEQDPEMGRRPRRRRWPAVLLVILALLAAGSWWALRALDIGQAGQSSAPAATPSSSVTASASVQPTEPTGPSSSQAPTVTRAQASGTPSRKPNVTLRSDLAFGVDSARLSTGARSAIDQVAQQVVAGDLHGRIFVDGYTDSTGSASHGVVLSQQRADAVSTYLQSQLLGAAVTIVSTGHGEAHPVADNATSAGRQANRRVTITLPRT